MPALLRLPPFALLVTVLAVHSAAAAEPAPRDAGQPIPVFHFVVVGGVNDVLEGAEATDGALPTETVSKIFDAHPKTERVGDLSDPPGSDSRLTGRSAFFEVKRGAKTARIKLTGLQGSDVPTGALTRKLVHDMGGDGLLLTVPERVGVVPVLALKNILQLVGSYERGGLFTTTNRVLLAHGAERTAELTRAAKQLRARLVIVTKPEDYRAALQQLTDAALVVGPGPKPSLSATGD